ncbi:MAG TPA: FlgD immunoglobulin-like domain containing protein [Candidatus Krumholzibacteria bacterium]|nr:FlgD immunoglobulin-like domain containing protein [Candidatus Krumholzibacteria bacterium]HPD70273.1 FlgD immunoglobulin-like domain containing protein [Candidatus Krumholzibacteria bacterium]HRY40027.1 FlgD immunoglobulin-like domain containing protein [Candidatus Krumholzibacteria bacterium]
MAATALVQCTFFANDAQWGGNVAADCSAHVTVDRCIIAACTDGIGLFVGEAPYCTAQLSCTDIWGNADGDWTVPFADQLGQDGNICADPHFCDAPARDFTILDGSPCAPAHSGGCGQIGAWPVGCSWPVPVATTAATTAALAPNVPNPFNPATTLRYTLPAAGPVRLAIFGLNGALVAELVDGPQLAGAHEVIWRGRDRTGRALPSGTYVAALEFAGERYGRRLVLLR